MCQKCPFPALFWHRLSRLSIRTASESQIEAPIWLPGRGPDREPDRIWPLFRLTPWTTRHAPSPPRHQLDVDIESHRLATAEWRSDARAHGDVEMSMKTFPPMSAPSTPVDADDSSRCRRWRRRRRSRSRRSAHQLARPPRRRRRQLMRRDRRPNPNPDDPS